MGPGPVKKEVREAVEYARGLGYTVIDRSGRGHVVALLRCPHGCCQISVNGTPSNPGTHAKQIKSKVDRYPGRQSEDLDE